MVSSVSPASCCDMEYHLLNHVVHVDQILERSRFCLQHLCHGLSNGRCISIAFRSFFLFYLGFTSYIICLVIKGCCCFLLLRLFSTTNWGLHCYLRLDYLPLGGFSSILKFFTPCFFKVFVAFTCAFCKCATC